MSLAGAAAEPSAWARFWASDFVYGFRTSPRAVLAGLVALVCVAVALLAPVLAQQNPFDPASYDLLDSNLSPAWMAGGQARYWLGTDEQGRDLLSLILYGMRISMTVGLVSILLAAVIGVSVGLLSGYAGGAVDAVLMRIADIQLSFPPILIALLIDGLSRAVLPSAMREAMAIYVLIFAIAISKWVLFARTIRGAVLVEKNKEYVQAARLLYRHPAAILVRHILPNAVGAVLVLVTINFSMAILTEATLSFLGVGVPPTRPSLGTLIKIGNEYLFSGTWWISLFPGVALIALVFSFNVLGDWLRDALNPRLR
jgi:peptide/nickel transport system permease protein